MEFPSFCCRESGPPECVFGVKVPSGYETVTKRLEEALVLVVFSVVLGGTVDCSDCYFPKIIFYCNGSSLYVLISVFCTYVVFEVLPNYHRCALSHQGELRDISCS
jgi:hypothetical protein